MKLLKVIMHRNKKCQGFTLIEILIVIVIISVISGIATLTLSHNRLKQYEYLANNLAHLITLAQTEAMLRSAVLGLAFTSESFQFFEYHNKIDDENKTHWHALTDRIFGLHRIAKNMELALVLQNKKVALDGQPKLIISISGDITPFTLLVGEKNQPAHYQVKGYANGNITSHVLYEK